MHSRPEFCVSILNFYLKTYIMNIKKLQLLILCLAGSFALQAQPLEKLWETDTILKVPECVVIDAQRNILYVSNIGSRPIADGNGSVGKLSREGNIIELEWVKGLNAPKGMALVGNQLYVAEPFAVVVIDVETGKKTASIKIENAGMLNDVGAAPNGDVYVSDSRGGKIYVIRNGKPEVVIEDLENPNGVLFTQGKLHFVAKGSLYVMEGSDKKLIAEGMEQSTDAVEQMANGDFLISCWSGIVYIVTPAGEKTTILDTREQKVNAADIGWDVKKRIMYVPTFWKNKVVAYKIL